MIVLAIFGLTLIMLALISRLFGLWFYRRVVVSSTRDIEPSSIPGVPWLRVESDATATQVLFKATYAAFPIGTVLVMVGAVFA